MPYAIRLRCECGQLKIDGKCPICDGRLAKPHRTYSTTEAKIKDRERQSNRLVINTGTWSRRRKRA